MKYLILTIKHKWFVFLAGLKIGCPIWRLITHDLSKFLPSELPHYQRQFFGDKSQPYEFIKCWLKHQNRNDHHWEYWIPRTGHSRCTPPYADNEPIKIPLEACQEMVADWLGAGRAYQGKWPDVNDWTWWKENQKEIISNMHPESVEYVFKIIKELQNKRRHK